MKGEPLGLGFVGCGGVASAVGWLLKLNRRFRIVACMSPTREEAESFAGRFRVPAAYTDMAGLCADGKVQALYIASPHNAHAPQIRQGILAGIPVLCEKPFTTNPAEAIALCTLARDRGAKIAVNYQYRYDRGCHALIEAARAGELGEILYGTCSIPWRREESYYEGSWRASLERSGGGTLLTQGSHALDILLCAAGGRPARAWGSIAHRRFPRIEVEDVAMGCVETDAGCLLSVTSSAAAARERPVRIELQGSRASAVWTGPAWPRLRVDGARLSRHPLPVHGIHPVARSFEAFRRWVVDGTEPLTTAASTLPVLSAVTTIYAAARSGRREEIRRQEGET